MKRRIEELLNNKYIYQAPKLVLSRDHLEFDAPADSSFEGEFFFSAEDNSRIHGTLISSGRRIVIKKDSFAGNAIHVRFFADTRGLVKGEQIQETITVLSSIGETSVSVHVQVIEAQEKVAHGDIRNLDGFAKLAQKDFRDAFHMFTGPEFRRLLKGKDSCWQTLHRGFMVNPIGYQHLEEFLIACGRKEAIQLSIDREIKTYEGLKSSRKNVLYVEKNTWGYVYMELEVRGDFLQVDKKVVTSDDFIGSLYGLEYVIRRDRLRAGKNYGSITIRTDHQTLTFYVIASTGSHADMMHRLQKRNYVTLLKEYLLYDTGKISAEEWKKHTLGLVSGPEERKNYFSCIYLTALHLVNHSSADAIAACWPVKNQDVQTKDPVLKGIGLFMMKETGLTDETEEEIRSQIYDLRMQAPQDPILFKIWRRIQNELTAERVLSEYERVADFGCHSPFLYSEVWKILKDRPQLLTNLDDLFMRTLLFAAERDLLTPEIAAKAAILAQHAKVWSPRLFKLLCACYAASPKPDILEGVLRQILLDNPGKPEYFIWYKEAVEKQIRVTRLYEYYLETLPMPHGEVLPKAIRLYFSYENRLRAKERVFLYANIIRNRNKDPQTYEKYRDAMAAFALEELHNGHMNEYYAVLYSHYFLKAEDRDMAESLAEVIFTHQVSLKDRSIRYIIVVNPYLTSEERYPVKNLTAYIQLYTGDEQILCEDSKHHRFAATVNLQVTPLMCAADYVESCNETGARSFGLLVHTMLPQLEYKEVSAKSIRTFLRIAEDDRLVEEYRMIARTKALQYYTRHEDEEMPEIVQQIISREDFAKKSKGLIVRVMLQRHKLAGAFDVICRYGYEHIEVRTLIHLCTQMIERMSGEENEELIYLAFELYKRGKANDTILLYLCENYIGSLEQMSQLRELLADRELNTKDMDEELLILSMFLRMPLKHPGEILESYMQGTFRENLVKAFIVFSAFRMVYGNEQQEDFIIDQMKLILDEDDESLVLCLALLKYYANCYKTGEAPVVYGWNDDNPVLKPFMSAEDDLRMRKLLERVTKEGIRFSYFRELPGEITEAFDLEDKTFIEYEGSPGETVSICYRLLGEGEKGGEFQSEPMKEMIPGKFSKEFMLFYGEVLEYTFRKNTAGRDENIYRISGEQIQTQGQSKYQQINQMLALLHVQHLDELDYKVQQYLRTDHMVSTLFKLI